MSVTPRGSRARSAQGTKSKFASRIYLRLRVCHDGAMSVPEILIRMYEPSDRQAVLTLAPRLSIGVASWRNADAVGQAVVGWVRDSLDGRSAGNREVLVAAVDNAIVGVVTMAERTHFTGEIDAHVGELAVAASHERQQIGSLLMRAAERWARDRGLRHLTLETGAANAPARAFYSHHGYHEEDVRLTKTL
jgi:GNAT superfamily N-acetyltransferase